MGLMKKRFLNDLSGAIITLGMMMVHLAFMCIMIIFADNSPNPWMQRLMAIIVCGSLSIAVAIFLFVRVELISISDNCAISHKMFKKTIINYSDIIAIDDAAVESASLGGYEHPCWKIMDSHGNSICIIKNKKSSCYIDFIKSSMSDKENLVQ